MLFILSILSITISGLLFCIMQATTPYDRMIDDMEQEKFIRNWNSKSKSN